MTWIIGVLAGMVAGVILGVVVDRDTVNKISGKIKIKGRGHHITDLVDLDLEDIPPGLKKRHIRKLVRMQKKLDK